MPSPSTVALVAVTGYSLPSNQYWLAQALSAYIRYAVAPALVSSAVSSAETVTPRPKTRVTAISNANRERIFLLMGDSSILM